MIARLYKSSARSHPPQCMYFNQCAENIIETTLSIPLLGTQKPTTHPPTNSQPACTSANPTYTEWSGGCPWRRGLWRHCRRHIGTRPHDDDRHVRVSATSCRTDACCPRIYPTRAHTQHIPSFSEIRYDTAIADGEPQFTLPFCTSRWSAPDCRTLCTRALRYCLSGRPPVRSAEPRATWAELCCYCGSKNNTNTNVNIAHRTNTTAAHLSPNISTVCTWSRVSWSPIWQI